MKKLNKSLISKTLLAVSLSISMSAFAEFKQKTNAYELIPGSPVGQPAFDIENNPSYFYVEFDGDIDVFKSEQAFLFDQIMIGSDEALIDGKKPSGKILFAKIMGEDKVFYHVFESDEDYLEYVKPDPSPFTDLDNASKAAGDDETVVEPEVAVEPEVDAEQEVAVEPEVDVEPEADVELEATTEDLLEGKDE